MERTFLQLTERVSVFIWLAFWGPPNQAFPPGTSDPYVQFTLNGEKVYKTEVKKKSLTPVWNENFTVTLYSRVGADFSIGVVDQLTHYSGKEAHISDSTTGIKLAATTSLVLPKSNWQTWSPSSPLRRRSIFSTPSWATRRPSGFASSSRLR